MSGATVAIAPVPLARSGRRLLLVPGVLFVAGLAAVAAGLLRGDGWGMALAAAGVLVGLLSMALALILTSVRLEVEVATLRVRRFGGERLYTLVRGPVTRVPLRGPQAARLRPSFGALGWGLGRARLRGDETIELVRMAPTDTMILVPTDRGRVGIAPASEKQLLDALAAAARIQQRLDEVAERAKAYMPEPAPVATPPPEPVAPTARGDAVAAPGHVLTGIERAILEERLAAQRAAALHAAEAERQAAANAARMAAFIAAEEAGKPILAAVQRPARRRQMSLPAVRVPRPQISVPRPHISVRSPHISVPRPHVEVPRPSLAVSGARLLDFAVLVLPVLAAVAVWAVAATQQRLDMPPTQLRPVAAALLATGPAAALAGIVARVWFPRLLGLVTITSLIGVALVARALLG